MERVINLKDLPHPPQITHPWLISFYHVTQDLRVVLGACLVYILAVQSANYLNRRRSKASRGTAKKGSQRTTFDYVVIAHNALLCLFSAFVFGNMVQLLVRNFTGRPLEAAFCDRDMSWANSGVSLWVWVFYVSKYYEVMDTVVLIAKGKQSSFLQTFHHAGSILSMWLQSAAHMSYGWVFVTLNSFIHTVMYAYYVLTCFGYKPSWKRLLTRMQITQFLIGDPIGLLYLWIPECYPPDPHTQIEIINGWRVDLLRFRYFTGYVTLFFVAALVLLFLDFSSKTYGKEDKSVKQVRRKQE